MPIPNHPLTIKRLEKLKSDLHSLFGEHQKLWKATGVYPVRYHFVDLINATETAIEYVNQLMKEDDPTTKG